MIVTHSETMLRDVANKLVVFHHEKVEYMAETYDDFLKKIGWDEEENVTEEKPKERVSRQDLKRMRSEMIIERSREISPFKKRMETLEKDIIKLEEEQTKLEADLIDLAAKSDSKKIQEVSQRLGFVKKKVEDSFEELTEVTIKHDDLFNKYEAKLKDLEI